MAVSLTVQEGISLMRQYCNYQEPVSYTHLRAHETVLDLVCRLLLENKTIYYNIYYHLL